MRESKTKTFSACFALLLSMYVRKAEKKVYLHAESGVKTAAADYLFISFILILFFLLFCYKEKLCVVGTFFKEFRR